MPRIGDKGQVQKGTKDEPMKSVHHDFTPIQGQHGDMENMRTAMRVDEKASSGIVEQIPLSGLHDRILMLPVQPVLPKPPAPRTLSSSSSTTCMSGVYISLKVSLGKATRMRCSHSLKH